MVTRYLLAGCILAIAAGVAPAGEPQSAVVTFQPGFAATDPRTQYVHRRTGQVDPGVASDFILDADGSVVLFAGEVSRWQSGKWSPSSITRPEGIVHDAECGPDGKWYVVSRQPYQQRAMLYQYSGTGLSLMATIQGRFQEGTWMTLHPAPDGTVWIAARGPTLYGVKNGKVITREMTPGGSPDYSASIYPPTVSLPVAGSGLWFRSDADYRASRATEAVAIKGFQVYDQNEWRPVAYPGGLIAGAVLVDSSTILCATRYKEMFSVSTAGGTVTDVNWTLPGRDCCVFLHGTPSHRVLAITAEPVMTSQLARTEAGAFGKLVVFENGKVRVLLDGVDGGGGRFDKGRPAVDTPAGTFIATVGGGLVFVSADASQVRRFDWRYDIPTANVDRMRVQGSLLYLLDRNRGIAIVDWEKLLRQAESAGQERWSTYTASLDPVTSADGAVWWLNDGRPSAELCRWRDGKPTRVSLEGSRLTAADVQFIGADTNGGVWLVPKNSSRPAACFNFGKWRVFDSAEAAWAAIAGEEKDNPSFGFLPSAQTVAPVFGGRGHAAYIVPESRRIRWFDGTTWLTVASFPRNDGGSTDEPPTFVDGVLTARVRGEYYQMREGQWIPATAPTASLAKSPINPAAPITPPDSFPGTKSRCVIALRDTADTLWMGTPDQLYRGLEDSWVRFPTAGTPIVGAERLSRVLVDSAGDLWFTLQEGSILQLARYACPGKAPSLEWARTPPSTVGTVKATLACRVQDMTDGGVLRYRSDGGPWGQIRSDSPVQEIVLENLPNGRHQIEVRAFDSLLRPSAVLTCTLDVKRDYDAEAAAMVSLLSSSDSRQREEAARTLVSIGPPAVPALNARKEHATADQLWWIRAILDEIERSKGGQPPAAKP
jgi:hypothetical protein